MGSFAGNLMSLFPLTLVLSDAMYVSKKSCFSYCNFSIKLKVVVRILINSNA